ncbi:MAG: GNAT family N-acetyltransferase, partial [Planctomycetaceae bacterium]|nr:GNAT family N-acetyltransferase [Planctomycetaceae bacterium]
VSELIVEEQARIQEGDIPFEPDLEMNTTDPAGTVVYRQDAVITMLRTSIQNGLRTELRNENRRDAIERIQLSDRDVWVRRFSLKEEPAAVIAEMENLRRQTEAQLPKQPHAQVPFNDLEHFLFVVRDAKELVGINTENASAGDHAWVIYDSEEGGQPIGFLHLSKNSEEAQDVNSAQYEIAVHPARRREGIAADLIEHVLLFLQQSPDAGIQIFSGDIHPENFASVTALYHAAENAGLDLYVRRDRPKEAWVFLVPLSGEPVLNAELFDYDAYAEVYRPEMRGFSNNIRRYIPYGNRSEDLSPSVIEAAIQQAREVAGRAVIARPYQMDIAEFLEQGNQRMNLVTPHVQGPVQLIAVRAHANVNPDQIFYIEIHDDLEEVLTAVGNYLSQAYPDNAFDLELGVSSAPAGYQDTLMMTVHSNDGIPAEVISPVSSMNPVFSQSPLESP